MKNVGVIYREVSTEAKNLAQSVVNRLSDRGLACRALEDQEALSRAEAAPEKNFSDGLDLIVVIGGDGTLLRVAQLVHSAEVKVIGAKLGGLGFLTEIQPEQLHDVIDDALAGKLRYRERMMLAGQVTSDKGVQKFRALNEVAITCMGMPRVINMHTRVDGDFVTSFRADGLLVSTPTGSTAYNMASGGPIVHPAMKSITITPVCPHTLTSRPLVIPESSNIEVSLGDGAKAVRVSPDAQKAWPLMPGHKVELRAAAHGITLACSPTMSYYEILRSKLRWGQR